MLHSNYLFLDIMDEKKSRIEKIYSRNNIKIPKIKTPFSWHISFNENKHNTNVKRLRKIIKILTVLVIAFLVADTIVKAIEPIITKQCINMAKSIATKVSNEQATIVMADYNYTDLMNITKDESGNIKMISANVITVNKIISDIPILIQDALNKSENNKFHILTREEYIDIVCDQLRLLNPDVVVMRITGDPELNVLVAPEWLIKKFMVLNGIDLEMAKRNIYQGDLL